MDDFHPGEGPIDCDEQDGMKRMKEFERRAWLHLLSSQDEGPDLERDQ